MKVIELARAAGATPDTVRHYTRIGLLNPARDAANGYRRFGSDQLVRLRFIQSARQLGFHLDEIGQILSMAEHGDTPCPLVREIVDRRIVETRRRLAEMSALQARLERAHELWREMPDGEPDGHAVCRLIEAAHEAEREIAPDPAHAARDS
ncbi:MAG: MerR family DNA-binding protein [Rhodocyclaceae bacterium]|nr:MerR family DNA-binding protein [Rhodocyclaceae bacterium]